MMTVKDLIDHLTGLPGDTVVWVPEADGDGADTAWRAVQTVEFSQTMTRKAGEGARVVKLAGE